MKMRKKMLALLLTSVLVVSLSACGAKTEEEKESVVASEEVQEEADLEVVEETDEEEVEEITYTPCTLEQIVSDVNTDLEAAKAKYVGQYLAVSGILEEIELDDMASPPGKIVRLETNGDASVQNPVWDVDAYSWFEEEYPMEEFEKALNELQPGDPVVVKVYVDDYFYDESMLAIGFSLLGVEKQ